MAERKLATRTFDFTAVPGGPHGEFPRQLVETLDAMERQAEELQEQISESSTGLPDLRLSRVKSVQETANPFEISADPAVHRPGTIFDDVAASGALSIQLPALEDIRQFYDLDTEIPHFGFLNTSAQVVTLLAGTDTTLEFGPTGGTTTSLAIPRDNTALLFALFDDRWRCLNPAAMEVAVRCQRSSVQSIANATEVYVDWNTENYDSHVFHDNSTNPSRLTVPTGLAGVYSCKAGVQFAANAGAATAVACLIRHFNSAGTLLNQGGFQTTAINSASVSQVIMAVYEARFAATDYIRVVVFQNHGVAVDISSPDNLATFVSMRRRG